MDPPANAPPNRIIEFCKNAPAPTVVRAKVRVAAKAKQADVEVERVWGSPPATKAMADHFASNAEDETLLVSLGSDGKVLGTSWPVFREQVSLELGIPDMKEEEAAGLLRSAKCADELRAFRDQGVRPAALAPTSGGGCAHCNVSSTPLDLGTALVIALTFVVLRGSWRDRLRSAPSLRTHRSGDADPLHQGERRKARSRDRARRRFA